MANLTIPEAIANNGSLSPEAKLAFSQLFSHLKKDERPSVQLKDVGMSIALGGSSLLDAVRCLHENGYAFLDETQDALENLIPGQECRISPRVHIEVLPHIDDSENAENLRRYADADKPSWDEETLEAHMLGQVTEEVVRGIDAWDEGDPFDDGKDEDDLATSIQEDEEF